MEYTKRLSIIISLIFIFINVIFIPSVNAHDGKHIKLDGDFGEWKDKPRIFDKIGDAPIEEDIHDVRYFTDNNYLYLNINRHKHHFHNEKWDFQVLILDSPEGKKTEHYIYKNGKVTSFKATTFEVSVYQIEHKGKNLFVVTVYKDGIPIETTFSSRTKGGEIEFKLPLSLVGLQGANKNIKFLIKSNLSASSIAKIEYVPDLGSILISTVPAIGNKYLEFLFFFIIIIIYRYYYKRKSHY